MHRPPIRRRYPRALCSELVQVAFHDQRGRQVEETCVLEDVGQQGARLSLSIPLTVGGEVTLRARGFNVVAGVAYCELEDEAYAVGLEFSAGTQWEEEIWTPEHLLRIPTNESSEESLSSDSVRTPTTLAGQQGPQHRGE
jgi:hypothetical protein